MTSEKMEVLGARTCPNATLALLMACLVGACGGGDNLEKASAAPADPVVFPVPTIQAGTWVVIGSSTAAGAGAPPDKGWTAVLQGELANSGARIANIARGGTVTYEGLSTAAPAVSGRPSPDPSANVDQALSRKPVLLIVSYPTNDTALGYRTGETVNNILSIRALALAHGVPVIVTSTQPRNLTAAQLGQLKIIDQRLAAAIGPCFVDVGTPLAASDGRLATAYDSGDGVHPNEVGHLVIARQLRSTLSLRQRVSVPAA